MNLQLSHLRSSPLAEAEPPRATGFASGEWARPFQRLFSSGASLTVAFAAAALLAACGGGSSDSVGSTGGDLSPRMAQIVGTVEVAKSVDMKVLVISATGTAPSYLAITSILDQIGVPFDKMVLKGTNATVLQMVAGKLSDGAGNGKYQGIILETGDLPYEETTNCAALGFGSPCYPSALTANQWQMLRQYQFDFGVRSATMYTRASLTPDSATGVQLNLTYGLTPVSSRNTNNYTDTFVPTLAPPVIADLTAAGAGVFSYLNSTNPVTVTNAFTYLATPVAGTQTVSLLNAKEGPYAIASVYTAPAGTTTLGVTPGGWENLAITADSNPELTHTLLMGYGIVNWVTKGVFLGERKIYMTAQPDDVFIPDELWDPATNTTPGGNLRYRNTGTDYDSLRAWQTALHSAHPNLAAFRLEIPFNGVGYNTVDPQYLNQGEAPVALPSTDSLSTAVRANPNAFRWINHTWDHTSLDPEGGFTPTVASIVSQLTWNHEVAAGLRSGNPNPAAPKVTFANYVKGAFIQPDISGLESTVFWEAAQNFGLQYILMDTSKPYEFFIPSRKAITRPDGTTTTTVISPNTGFYSSEDKFVAGNPRIFIIPRFPTNLFYNNSTPTEWVSEYNFLYASKPPSQGGIGFVSTYQQILDREAEVLVRYMLKFNVNSWMFHAANLRDYDGAGGQNKSTLSDLLDAVAQQYSAMYNLQVLSPSQAEIGEIMKARMAYNAAMAGGVKGRIVFGPSVTIQVTNPTGVAVTVPLTGAVSGGVSYGGQQIAPLAVVAGGTTTVAAPAGWIPAQADMAVTIVPSTSTPLQGGTLTYSVAIRNLGPNSVTGASFSNSLQAGLGTITNVVTQVSAGATTPTFATTPTSLSGLVSMPAGGQITVTYQASVSATATGTLTSTASVTEPADRNDPNSVNNSVTSTVSVGLADVSTLVTLPTTAIAGSVVTGTVTFSNASVVTGGTAVAATAVTGTVTLSNGDVKPFTVGTLTPGQSSVQNFTTTMPSLFGAPPLTASSTVVTATPESNKANNVFGGATTTALFADPGVSVNSIPAGTPGSSVQATVILSNTAGQTAVTFTPQIVVNNGTPYTLTPVFLAAGQTVTSAAISVPITASGGTVTANVTLATVPDLNLSNNSDTKVGGVVYADVSSAVVLPASAVAGSVFTGTVTFTNQATAGAAALAVTGGVTLSNGDVKSFTVGTLTPGQSNVQTFTTTMPSTVGTTALSATSTVATTTPESNTANNTFVGATSTVLFADPGVLVNSIPAGTPGSTVQTTVILSNTAGQTPVTFTPQVVVNGGTPFNLANVTLAAGASATSVAINVPITAGGGTVTANVTLSTVPDKNLSNNSDTKVSGVVYADVSSSVVLPASAVAGSVVTGTVTFTNEPTAGAAALAVTGGVTLSNGDAKAFTVGNLTVGQSNVQTFTTTMPSTVGTTALSATSTVATTTPQSNTTNDTFVGASSTVLFADPGVSVNSFPAGTPGSTVQTTVILSNTAGQTAVTFTPQIVVNNGTPTSLAPVTLAAGASATSVPINVPITVTGGTVKASVTASSVPDSNLGNNSDTKVGGVVYADVSSSVVLPASAVAGSVVTGTVTFTNEPTAGAAALAVTGGVTLSNGDAKAFTVGNLTVGQSNVQTFTTTMPSTVGTTALSATSTVSTTTPESNKANNTSSVSVVVTPPPAPAPTPDPVPPVVEAPEPVVDVGGGGGGGCTTSPDARFDPLLWMMLLAGGVATGLRRRRAADIETDRH